MSSQLYKVLNNIESGRQDIKKELKLKGIETEENASLQDLASSIGMLTINDPASEEDMETWTRPSEWPDTKTILAEAEQISNVSPSIILLLNNKYDTFSIPQQNYENLGLNGGYYKMSDGTIYTDQLAHTHTWDASKDIDGKYRYVLCYYPSAPSRILLPGKGLIEAIVGKFSSSISYSPFVLGSSDFSQYHDLINFEFLSTSNATLSHCAMGQYAFCYLPKLEHINLGSLTGYNSYTNSVYFQYLPKLQIFEAPNFTSVAMSFTGMPNLRTVYIPKFNGSLSMSNLMSTYNLRRIISGRINFSGYYFAFIPVHDNMYFPVEANIYPINANKIKITSNFRWNYSYAQPINLASPFLTTVDFSECIPSSIDWYPNSCFTIGALAPRLRHIIWPTKICGNISLEFADVDIESLTSLFAILPDATNIELTYTPYVRLGEKNLAKLSAADIKVATDKGWEVQ